MAAPPIVDDLSTDFSAISGRLVHPSGLTYREFRTTLRPLYWKIWADILLGHAGLLCIAIALIRIPLSGWP
jgi:hypothetical protein